MNKEIEKLRLLQSQTNHQYGKIVYVRENLQAIYNTINILINIGKNENPQDFKDREDLQYPHIISLGPHPIKTEALINFYKGCLLCDDYFKWELGSVAFHQYTFKHITEKLPPEEFSEKDRENLWNWSLARCRGKNGYHYNSYSPNNSSKYDSCYSYDDKLRYDARAEYRRKYGCEAQRIQQKQKVERRKAKKKLNIIKEKRKALNEKHYRIEIKAFKVLTSDEKNKLFRELEFKFPLNLMPTDEFIKLSSNPSNNAFNSIDELNLYIEKFPRRTIPHVTIFRKSLIRLKKDLNDKVGLIQ